MSLYLDIETDRNRNITVFGLYHYSIGIVQLVHPNISRNRLLRLLPQARQLVTFNGHCFDLPIVQQKLDLDLRSRYLSLDLRYVCLHVGWAGGQKAIEQKLGLKRQLPGLNGLDAMRLWALYDKYGNEAALSVLLKYNREDLMQMVRIRQAVRRALVS